MTASAVPQKTPSVWEDFIDIFISPSEVFARREKASFFLPMVVVSVVIAILIIGTKSLILPVLDADIARQFAAVMRSNPQVTADQLQKGRAMAETIGLIAIVVMTPISIFVVGLVLWVVSKFFDSTLALGAAVLIASYAAFPRILQSVAAALIAAFSDPAKLDSMSRLSVGPAHFLDVSSTSPIVMVLLARFDLFIIWSTVLLGIGLVVIGKVSRGRAAAAATIVWIAGALMPLYQALKLM